MSAWSAGREDVEVRPGEEDVAAVLGEPAARRRRRGPGRARRRTRRRRLPPICRNQDAVVVAQQRRRVTGPADQLPAAADDVVEQAGPPPTRTRPCGASRRRRPALGTVSDGSPSRGCGGSRVAARDRQLPLHLGVPGGRPVGVELADDPAGGHRLVDDLPDVPGAFRPVAVEHRRRRPARCTRRKPPGERPGVTQARAEPLPHERRHEVGGVAGEEDVARAPGRAHRPRKV